MPEFERDPWGAVDAHQAALNHCGIKNNGMPEMPQPPKDTSHVRSSVKLTEGTASVRPPVSPQPPVRTPAPPARVGRSRFGEERMPTDPKPAKVHNQGPRSQSPNVEIRKIYRTDGKFDPATIQGAGDRSFSARYTPPASPSRPPAHAGTPTSSRPPMKRADSKSSTSSWRARRDSMSKLARRMSDAFKEKFDIVKMDKHDRRDYVRSKYDEEEKKKRSRDSACSQASPCLGPRDRHSQPIPQLSDDSDFEGKPRPGNLSKGEKFAIGVSKAIDPLKPRGRSGTNDSDMSFGMTDLAPPGEMQECAECLNPTSEYLIRGLCKDCHNLELKVLKRSQEHMLLAIDEHSTDFFTDPFQFPQDRATWPDVRSPEHGYLKLPSKKKILRIRQTIYEDPGNPFADEIEAENVPLGHNSESRLTPTPEDSDQDSDIFELGRYGRAVELPVPATPKNSIAGPAVTPPPMERRGSASAVIRAHRRSNSVAVPLASAPSRVEEYVAPRTFWRRESMPAAHLPQLGQSAKETARDAKFYGFYDDIMKDYRARDSRI